MGFSQYIASKYDIIEQNNLSEQIRFDFQN